MKFITHNFAENWSNATGSDDHEMQKDMIITEVEKIIADQPADFIASANKSGIKLAPNASSENMVDAFLNNLENQKFQRELAVLILQTNKVNFLNLSEDPLEGNSYKETPTTGAKQKFNWGNIFGGSGSGTSGGADPISAVANGIGAIAGIFKAKQEGKNLQQQTRNEMLASLNSPTSPSSASSNKAIYWVGGILIVGMLTLIAIKVIKNKK